MLSLGSSQLSSDILSLLGVQIQYQSMQPVLLAAHKSELTPVEFQNIASVIAAYSFFEILAIRAKLVSRIPYTPSTVKMYLPPSRTKSQPELHVSVLCVCLLFQNDTLQGMDSINDWFNILFNFRKVMTKFNRSGEDIEAIRTGHSLVSLLRMVARSNTNNDYFRIENNILHAALHVNALNSVIFSPDQVPDLPRDLHRSKYP